MTIELRIYSDIHQEYQKKKNYPAKFFQSPFHIEEYGNEKEQVLIIAGDLLYLKDLGFSKNPEKNIENQAYMNYIEQLSQRFKEVLYVFGNHEFYMSKLGKSYVLKAQATLSHIKNLHIISRHTPSVIINDVKFVGATLWTDLKNEPSMYHYYEDTTGDFKYITYNEGSRFTNFRTNHWIKEHIEDFKWIKQESENSTHPVIVISHHAPTSITKDPVDDPKNEFSAFYTSNLDDFITHSQNIKMWIHGHIHYPYDYVFGGKRIFSNPQDYEINKDNNPERSYIMFD